VIGWAEAVGLFALAGFFALWARLCIARIRRPRDWWKGDWPTLDPFYREVQRRLDKGESPPSAWETRTRSATELLIVLASLAVLVASIVRGTYGEPS
jgi:hypothetical protein